MKKIHIILVFVLGSCAPVYIPSSRNVPQFTKAGEFQGTINYSHNTFANLPPRIKPKGDDIDLQGAVSITNHFAAIADYSFSIDRSLADSTSHEYWNHVHQSYEIGLGFYNIEKTSAQVFGGYGSGKGAVMDPDASNYERELISDVIEGKYNRFFIQFSVNPVNRDSRQLIFTTRIAYVDFTEIIKHKGPKVNPKPRMSLEPSVTFRCNLLRNRLFLITQAGLVIPRMIKNDFDTAPFNLTCGLNIRLGGNPSN
jgi:hypothetical protein